MESTIGLQIKYFKFEWYCIYSRLYATMFVMVGVYRQNMQGRLRFAGLIVISLSLTVSTVGCFKLSISPS
jgi:hypothetical protein